jgi:Cd(II)/Pb(II)-responsive transcriptional regulator
MRIGELAAEVGVSVATIRFYEREGLLPEPPRSESNYRQYGPVAAQRLTFIARCRSLDIGMAEIRRLLDLTATPEAHCGEVDAILDAHIRKVREQRLNLAKLEKALLALRRDCHPSMQVQGCGILRDSALIARGNRINRTKLGG